MQVETDDKFTGYKLVFYFAEEGDPEVLAVSIEENLQHAAERIPARIRKAVRDGRLYVAPEVPFPWLDSPPSVNRLIGLKWLGRVLYREAFPEDLRDETRNFYSLFYHRAPDERQLNELLSGTGRAR